MTAFVRITALALLAAALVIPFARRTPPPVPAAPPRGPAPSLHLRLRMDGAHGRHLWLELASEPPEHRV